MITDSLRKIRDFKFLADYLSLWIDGTKIIEVPNKEKFKAGLKQILERLQLRKDYIFYKNCIKEKKTGKKIYLQERRHGRFEVEY